MNKNEERDPFPDMLRGFAIILVVLGHCIQQGSGEVYRVFQLYFSDRFYQFIYSFHMPLFMMVSGYLNWTSMKNAEGIKERRVLLRKRASTLILPIFLWTVVDCIKLYFMGALSQQEPLFLTYCRGALEKLWFLWAVWWCFLIVYCVHYFFKDNIYVYIIGFLFMFVVPDGLGLGAYKYMFPYFLIAFYFHGWAEKREEIFQLPAFWMTIVTGIIFFGSFTFFEEDSFIYLSGYKLIGKNIIKQIGIDVYRFTIGFFGSTFFILVWRYSLIWLTKYDKIKSLRLARKLLCQLGISSMGIYILSEYFLLYLIPILPFGEEPSYLANIIETVIVIVLSLPLAMLFGRIPYIKKLVGK